jgi:signal transduction histidine kinase
LFVALSIPSGVLFFLVALLGGFHGTLLLVVSVSVLLMIGYIASSALGNMKQSASLVAARAEAWEANQAKSSFLAIASHEIRTPLNGLLGMAQAMAADPLLPGQGERLEVLRQSGESLMAILNDLLDITKIEAGKVEIEAIEFDLDELARGAKATFAALAAKKGLGFKLEMLNARGLYLGDPTRTRQVLFNLISNAIKFTDTGHVRVDIRYDTGELVFSVTDSGIGMTTAGIDRLFVKFSQAEASTTRQFGGTGLGLAICKQLADLMAGRISVTSRPGEGSVFVFRAPYVRVGEPRARRPTEPRGAAPAGGLAVRVLAAEDNAINRLVLATSFNRPGSNR